ncbi:response regulator [Pleionea sediminis]|uniref:response regulator n=1 Tax=Pleionea sediminis TaxID=2569479 RepID=UPI001185AFF9|nr:response regulator [Pleionea sediminis]
MNNVLNDQSNEEFKKIICRRVPIKLQQFARLLSELAESQIDVVRVKAMESQIRKTKELCTEYGAESTANLLTRISSQLTLDNETLESQKPLIRRFIDRLHNHAEKLKQGQLETSSGATLRESANDSNEPTDETHEQGDAPEAHQEPDIDTHSPKADSEELDLPNQESLEPAPSEIEPMDAEPAAEAPDTAAEHKMKPDSVEQTAPESFDTPEQDVQPRGLVEIKSEYEFKHSIIDEAPATPTFIESGSELTVYWCMNDEKAFQHVRTQIQDFGYEVENLQINAAIEQSAGNSQKVVITQLNDFDDDVEQPINETSHLIVLAEHDTLEQRLKGIRLGSTLFFANPVDSIKLMEHLEELESSKKADAFRVAVMEDSKAQAKFNDKVLSSAGFETCIIIDPMELLNSLSNFDPEVIFMDMQMPGCNGIELTKVLRQQERFKTVPIVFLSAEENHDKQREAMTSGGSAFIAKPVKKDQLLFTAELYARRTRNLEPHLARDFQTGLNSSALLKEQLTIETERAMRQNDSMFLALIEMNNLTELNEKHGYAFGERATQQLARLLRQRLRKTDCIGFFDTHRIGVILNHCSDQEAESIMSYLTQTFAGTPVAYENKNVHVTLSVGISKLGTDYDVQRLVKRSEAALSQAQNQSESHLIWADETRK